MPLCIFAESQDLVPSYVAWLAARRNIPVLWLSESKLGEEWFFRFDDKPEDGYIKVKDKLYPFAQLLGAYVNMNPRPALPYQLELAPEDLDVFMGERRNSIRHLINSLPIPVANRLNAGRSNNSKPYQMELMAEFGFRIPEWITSNDLREIEAFAREYKDVICKSISGLRSRVRRLDDEMRERLEAGTTPIIVQRYVAGSDVRIHTVQSKAFATEIRAGNSVDYRFEKGDHRYHALELDPFVEEKCFEFALKEDLLIAGFDFRLTPENEFFCLEMNPFPTFMVYEIETGQPIGDALLDVLAKNWHESA